WARDRGRWLRLSMVWTAALLWIQPVHSTVDFGQINLLLAAIVLASMGASVPSRSWLAGCGVGIAAGIKLIPSVSGVYFLATKRWAAAVWSFAWFVFTIAAGFVISPGTSTRFWTDPLGITNGPQPYATAHNQSLRGALSRSIGHDVGMGWPWLLAVAIAALLCWFAMRAALRADEHLLAVLAVQLFALLASPISWDHHWVWLAPLLIWLVHKGIRQARELGRRSAWRSWRSWPAIVLLVLWLPVMYFDVIQYQLDEQDRLGIGIWNASRPGWLSAIGWAYPAFALLTLAVLPLLCGQVRQSRSTALAMS
ncbi:MAG: DUF2029 domain-containing protein, partial [Sciscionella sp.]|nr:DUF2029 domain-containing protein [Sciscionella sp.]